MVRSHAGEPNLYFVRLCWLGHRPFTSVRGDRHPYEVPEFMGNGSARSGHLFCKQDTDRFESDILHHILYLVRLSVEDAALSRRKDGFDSRTEYHTTVI